MPPLAIPVAVGGAEATLQLAGVLGAWWYGSKMTAKPAEQSTHAQNQANSTAQPGTTAPTCNGCKSINDQKQAGHVKGTPQNKNRKKQGKPTSEFDGDRTEADNLTQEAWQKGTPVAGRPNVKDYDFGRRIGTGPNGGGQGTVRVHEDGGGQIHGHPSGQEKY